MVISCIFIRRESQVAFPEEENLIVLSQKDPYSNIELFLSNQHRAFDVFLNDKTQNSQIV